MPFDDWTDVAVNGGAGSEEGAKGADGFDGTIVDATVEEAVVVATPACFVRAHSRKSTALAIRRLARKNQEMAISSTLPRGRAKRVYKQVACAAHHTATQCRQKGADKKKRDENDQRQGMTKTRDLSHAQCRQCRQ